jgi:GNAT superfamily N-acetyltransferase
LILECFKRCTQRLLEIGIDQWDYSYPSLKDINADIQAGTCFIIINPAGIACITINQIQDPQYEKIRWRYLAPHVFVIHRLAVDPALAGRGFGKELCLFAEDHVKKMDGSVLRLDTYTKNPISNRLYTSLEYDVADGFCYFHGIKTPFICYEKKLD